MKKIFVILTLCRTMIFTGCYAVSKDSPKSEGREPVGYVVIFAEGDHSTHYYTEDIYDVECMSKYESEYRVLLGNGEWMTVINAPIYLYE